MLHTNRIYALSQFNGFVNYHLFALSASDRIMYQYVFRKLN